MTAADPNSYTTAFDQLVGTLFKIASSPGGLLVILLLGLLAMAVVIVRQRRALEKLFEERYKGLKERLDHAEERGKECDVRERSHMLAIAMLHGILRSVEGVLPASIKIPDLNEIFSGRWSTAQKYNPEVSNLPDESNPHG